jgi:hypothetical protein
VAAGIAKRPAPDLRVESAARPVDVAAVPVT